MHVALETISWGRHPDVEQMLRDVRAAGYEGVEFSQHPDDLRAHSHPPDCQIDRRAEWLYSLMRLHGLKFVGIAGGALQEKIDFIQAMILAETMATVAFTGKVGDAWRVTQLDAKGTRPYVYIDDWNDSYATALAIAEVTLAIHPHMFKPVQTAAEAEALLAKHAKLRFLPDVAHLTAAGEDVLKVLTDNFDRVEAVHLKDWSAVYGRGYQFYSHGFTGLGRGDVKLDEILSKLREFGFNGWLVVEQDSPGDPVKSARSSRQWLRRMYGI